MARIEEVVKRMDWIESYENSLKQTEKSLNTIISYTSDIRDFLQWFIFTYGKEFDGQVLEQDTREYRSFLLNVLKQKPSSINRKMAALKNFNLFLINHGTGKDTPLSGISVFDNNDKEILTIDRNDLNRLKRSVYAKGNKRDIALFEFLVNTGIRVSELISLTLEDICLTERNGRENYSYIIVRNGKGGKYREVPLNTSAKKAVEDYLTARSSKQDNLFIGQRGPLRRESIDKILKKYCIQSGIDPISAHILRHTFCTRLMGENVPIPIISKLVGHSNIQTTMDFYIRVSRADKFAAVEKL